MLSLTAFRAGVPDVTQEPQDERMQRLAAVRPRLLPFARLRLRNGIEHGWLKYGPNDTKKGDPQGQDDRGDTRPAGRLATRPHPSRPTASLDSAAASQARRTSPFPARLATYMALSARCSSVSGVRSPSGA